MERRDESVEAKGRNVEEAIANGLAQLRLSREQVDVEILNRGSRGVLGLGAEEARVLLTPIKKPAAPEVQPATKATPPQAPVAAPTPKSAPAPTPKPAARPAAEPDDEEEGADWVAGSADELGQVQDVARQSLAGLLQHMSISADVVVKQPTGIMIEEGRPKPVVLDIVGDDLGVLIGRRGETLAALQYLVRLMVNRQTRRWVNVVVDVEGYKERRERQLQQLAERTAERVVSTQKSVVLEPMPAYERRIIHLTLREHPQVTTHSIGEGENRKVMILMRQ
jgi:spoIIIJ-associated protein